MSYAKLDSVTKMLDYLEKNIDEKHCEETEKRQLDAIYFKPNVILPLAIMVKPQEELLPRDEAFYNPEIMLHNELLESEPDLGNLINSVDIKDDYPLHIRCFHGIAMNHSVLGGEYRVDKTNQPWCLPLDISLSEYRRKWEDKLIKVSENRVVKTVVESYEYFKYRLSDYPKCSKYIRLTPPNFNSPFSTAQSFIGNDLFMEMYDNPDNVHWLMKRVTDLYLETFKLFKPLMNNYTADGKSIYIHGNIWPCETILKNDTAVAMLSEEHYKTFSRPYDEIIARELGSVCLHYCGKTQPFHNEIIKIPEMTSINFGNPEMQDIETVINVWNKNKIAIIAWGNKKPPKFLYDTVLGRNLTGFSLNCLMQDKEEAVDFMKRYREDYADMPGGTEK